MELIWLEDYLALAETLNFSRAAEARHVTQPAFSRRIRALENWVGADLFARTTHGVALTPAGEHFHNQAEVLTGLERAVELAMQEPVVDLEDFRVGEADRPVYPQSPVTEFRLMNAHFMKATENADREYRNLREFSENASHELQTPLAIVRSNLDLLAQEKITEHQSELLQSIYGSVRRMTRLQDSLLLL